MRTLWTSRHFSSATPPAGEPSDEVVIEDANKSTGTPSFFFLGIRARSVNNKHTVHGCFLLCVCVGQQARSLAIRWVVLFSRPLHLCFIYVVAV